MKDPWSAKSIDKTDPSGLHEVMLSLPEQVREGWSLKRPRLDIARPDGITVLGMGGSAIGGDMLASCLSEKGGPPVFVNRDYSLPSFVGRGTLVFAVSYSGNTEETLAAFKQAERRCCPVVSVSSGGKLARAADPGMHITLPAGLQPRAALGLLLAPLLGVLYDLGIAGFARDVDEAVSVLSAMKADIAPGTPAPRNIAKAAALCFQGAFPVILSGTFLAPAARRWRTQLNENAKVLAADEVLPEMDHNGLVGWSSDPMAGDCAAVLLRDDHENPRVAKRFGPTRRLGLDRARSVLEVRSRGSGALARLLSASMAGDLASFYLAVLRGVDPAPVAVIEDLKKELAV